MEKMDCGNKMSEFVKHFASREDRTNYAYFLTVYYKMGCKYIRTLKISAKNLLFCDSS